MPQRTTSMYCPSCEARTAHHKAGCNHLVHALVTLFLLGLWLPIWILAGLNAGMSRWSCNRCGTGSSSMVSGMIGWAVVIAGLLSLGLVTLFAYFMPLGDR